MGFHPEVVQEAAEEQDVSTNLLGNTLQRIRNYAADNVEGYLENAWHVNSNSAMLGHVNESYIVALDIEEWEELAEHIVIDEDMLEAVKAVHLAHSRNHLESLKDVDIPDTTTPFVIDYPENWGRAQGIIHQHWGHYFHHGFTPAEVIDYWMIEKTKFSSDNWAKIRNVEPEAVRKNVRQAKGKLPRDLPL